MTAVLQASIPRSGNHLLLKLLWDAIPNGQISTCEFYTAPNCCKQIPCLNLNSQFMHKPNPERHQGGDHLFVHKTHDFQLSDLPTSDYGTLFQLRDPLQYLFSHLIWEMSSLTDFSVGSALAFVHKCAIYYIRMYVKWAVLYSDLLVVPPIYYESLLTKSGKTAALRGLSKAIGFSLTNEQIDYSIEKSTIHSHSGKSFTASVARQADIAIANPLVLAQCASFASSILYFLPSLSTLYSVQSSEGGDRQNLLPFFNARVDPDEESFSTITVRLAGDRKAQDGDFVGRELYLEGTGIGRAFPDGSYMIGCVTLLPIKLSRKAPISRIEAYISSPDSRLSENKKVSDETSSEIAFIYLEKVIGWFEQTENPSVLCCRVVLDQPIIPYSESIMLALGVRPRSNLVSVCDQSRAFRFVSEIVVRLDHR
jgi:hypothetical protein